MYNCDICTKTTKSGEKQNKVIIETREKTYYNTDKYGKEKISKGWEIVNEINVCDKCLSQMS